MAIRIYTPNRKVYKRKYGDSGKCPFCSKANLKRYQSRSLSSKYWNCLANPYPYAEGNIILASKNHYLDIDDLTVDEWSDLFKKLIKVKKTLGKLFKTKSFNIGINIGPLSGGTLEHLHFQVIPRNLKNASVTSLLAELQNINLSAQDLLKLVEEH